MIESAKSLGFKLWRGILIELAKDPTCDELGQWAVDAAQHHPILTLGSLSTGEFAVEPPIDEETYRDIESRQAELLAGLGERLVKNGFGIEFASTYPTILRDGLATHPNAPPKIIDTLPI